MKITLLAWAAGILKAPDVTTLDRFTELFTVNGRETNISKVGTPIRSKDNRYGRLVLTPSEAMELAFMAGALSVLTLQWPEQTPIFWNEVERISSGSLIQIVTEKELNIMGVQNS